MLSAIFTALAALVGYFTWSLLFIFIKSNPIGAADSIDYLVVYSPVVFFAIPLSIRLYMSGQIASPAWLLALTPVLSALNFAAIVFCSGMFGVKAFYPSLAAACVWLILSIPVFFNKHDIPTNNTIGE